MTIERKAQSCRLSSVNPYLELRKYLNPERQQSIRQAFNRLSAERLHSTIWRE